MTAMPQWVQENPFKKQAILENLFMDKIRSIGFT
jgi:hypothetical protein